MEMELDRNAVRCDDSAASSALNAASGTVEASAGGWTPWQQQQPMALTFTMLRPDDGGGTPGQQQQLVTQELFPVMPPPGRSGGSGLWEPAGAVEQAAKKKSRRGPRSRSSEYRGVTFYRRTSRWESHIWDCGKQVYLGGFDTAHAAARAYDRAAIKFRGMGADINFNVRDYDEDMKQMKQLSKEEVVRLLRRRRQMTAGCLSRSGSYDCARCTGGGGVYLRGQLLQAARAASYEHKAAIKCNGREAATNHLEPPAASIYDGDHHETMLHTQSGVDVDLNLRISQPSGSPYRPKTETKRKGGTYICTMDH